MSMKKVLVGSYQGTDHYLYIQGDEPPTTVSFPSVDIYLTGVGFKSIDTMTTYIPDATFIKYLDLSNGAVAIDGRSVNGPLSKYDDGSFVYKGPYDGSQFNDIGIPLDQACSHEMKEYIGLTKKYNYCSKCDYKDE